MNPCFQFKHKRRSTIARSHGNTTLSFLRNCRTFLQLLRHFTFPPTVHEGFDFSTSWPTLTTCCGFVIVAILTGIKWHLSVVFLITNDAELCTHALIGHLCIFFGKMSSQLLCPFLNTIVHFLLLRCRSSLYTLGINPFSDMRFATIFSHSVGRLFTLLTADK